MPGGASNTGAEWVAREYAGVDLDTLGIQAAALLPTGLLRYPLVRHGERFPFRHPQAAGFCIGEPRDPAELFAAGLEGLALLERLAYDTLAVLGAQIDEPIYVTGGAARSNTWLLVRACALGRTLARPAIGDACMGAALLAAAPAWFGSLGAAARAMVRVERQVEPDRALQEVYNATYERFVDELRRRGYVERDGMERSGYFG
jgi:sugar (pentulose or hexulose) kinase